MTYVVFSILGLLHVMGCAGEGDIYTIIGWLLILFGSLIGVLGWVNNTLKGILTVLEDIREISLEDIRKIRNTKR